MRASAVEKQQSVRMVSRGRRSCRASISRRRVLWSGTRCSKHCRAGTPIPISAIPWAGSEQDSANYHSWTCSGPPDVRRCAVLQLVQMLLAARLDDGCSVCLGLLKGPDQTPVQGFLDYDSGQIAQREDDDARIFGRTVCSLETISKRGLTSSP